MFAAVGVEAPRQQTRVRADVERAEREVLVSRGFDVLVEKNRLVDEVAIGAAFASAAVNGVLATLLGARDVPPAVLERGNRLVGLLDARLDLGEQRVDQTGVGREQLVGVLVLGLQVGDGVGIVAIGEPMEVVGHVAGGSMVNVGHAFGRGSGHRPEGYDRSRATGADDVPDDRRCAR